jgi:hypothetical protein
MAQKPSRNTGAWFAAHPIMGGVSVGAAFGVVALILELLLPPDRPLGDDLIGAGVAFAFMGVTAAFGERIERWLKAHVKGW